MIDLSTTRPRPPANPPEPLGGGERDSDLLASIASQLELIARRLAEPAPRFLGMEAAGAYSGLSADSIRRLVQAGKLAGYRPVPGRVVVDREELERFVLSATTRVRQGRGQSRRGGSK